jgi:dephospho-CoA kinase
MRGRGDSRMMLGVTGGIGSGKTSVCRVFSVLGIPVFSADPEAKRLMDTDGGLRKEINRITGRNMYRDGILDRPGLASLIFNNRDFLLKVNAAVHPVVLRQFREWTSRQNAPYVIIEVAILFESGAADIVDRILTVTAPMEERIERVMMRNSLTREQVLERIRNQHDDEYLVSRSDYVIRNSENDMIIPAVLDIHRDMLSELKLS